MTETNRSPRPRPPSTGIPLPFRRNTVPVCVPIGIFSFSSPSSVLTIDLGAQGGLRKGDRERSVEVASLSFKLFVFGTWITTYKVARRPALCA